MRFEKVFFLRPVLAALLPLRQRGRDVLRRQHRRGLNVLSHLVTVIAVEDGGEDGADEDVGGVEVVVVVAGLVQGRGVHKGRHAVVVDIVWGVIFLERYNVRNG